MTKVQYDISDLGTYKTEQEVHGAWNDHVCKPGRHRWFEYRQFCIDNGFGEAEYMRSRYSEHENNIDRNFSDKAVLHICKACRTIRWAE